MSKTIYVNVITKLIIDVTKDADIDDIISEINYDFTSTTEGASVDHTEIVDYIVTKTE